MDNAQGQSYDLSLRVAISFPVDVKGRGKELLGSGTHQNRPDGYKWFVSSAPKQLLLITNNYNNRLLTHNFTLFQLFKFLEPTFIPNHSR